MALKVVHIDRKKLNLQAEAKAFWENVLKPKWEKRAREDAEKMVRELKSGSKCPPQEFITQRETKKPGEKLEIVIEVDGNKLKIRQRTKKVNKNSDQNSD